MKKELFHFLLLAVIVSFSTKTFALTVYGDFSWDHLDPSKAAAGDQTHDSRIEIGPNTPFTVSIYADVNNLHDGLNSYGVETKINPPTLTATNVSSDPTWFLPENTGINNVNGTAWSFDGKLSGEVGSTVHLFDVEYTIGAPGLYLFTMGDVFPNNSSFDGNVAGNGFVYDGSVDYLSTDIIVTPIPAGIWLFASALLAGFGLIIKRQNRQRHDLIADFR